MSIKIDKKVFHNFYQENINFFQYIDVKSHPINEENFNKWIISHNPDKLESLKDLEILASLFRKYSKHVSYTEFRAKIASICSSIRAHKDNYDSIVLCLNTNIDKSNFWIGMLNYHFLNDIITDIVPNSLEYYIQKRDDEKILGIICDDASYTGKQLKIIMGNIPNYMDAVLSVPYMSKYAFNLIKKVSKKILFPSQIEIFLSFEDNISKDIQGEGKIIAKKYKFDIKRYTIYFDHKLADLVSIYQTIYAFGIPLNKLYEKIENKDFTPISLITGCDLSPYFNLWLESGDRYDIQDIFKDIKKMCPIPFYKLFQYKYNGKRLSDINLFVE